MLDEATTFGASDRDRSTSLNFAAASSCVSPGWLLDGRGGVLLALGVRVDEPNHGLRLTVSGAPGALLVELSETDDDPAPSFSLSGANVSPPLLSPPSASPFASSPSSPFDFASSDAPAEAAAWASALTRTSRRAASPQMPPQCSYFFVGKKDRSSKFGTTNDSVTLRDSCQVIGSGEQEGRDGRSLGSWTRWV